MTRVDEFNSFYTSTFSLALRVTYAVSGDRHVAFESTVDAYRRAWRDWSKIREGNPLAYVRNEAWKLTGLSRGTHPLRRKHEDDSDTQVLDALGELSVTDRRLIVLMTLGNTDLDEASHEVNLPAEEGIESVTNALASLEAKLGQTIDQIERRMNGLAAATDTFQQPSPATIRKAAKRGRQRNTVILVAASIAMVIGGGFVVTEGDALDSRASLPYREKIGAERPDVVLASEKIDEGNLLTADQVNALDLQRAWAVDATDTDLDNTTPYSTCPTKRFSDTDPLKVLVRTYSANGLGKERVAQSIEVSRSASIADEAYRRLVRWYADCQHPRVQLVDSYAVKRAAGDFHVLVLRSQSTPVRTFTIGFSHSGNVTSTLVHEVDGARGPTIAAFASTLNASVSRLCRDTGSDCSDQISVKRTEPPRTTQDPDFLGIVDLPAIAEIDRVWVAVDAFSTGKANPAATECDGADFSAAKTAMSKVFVIPQAKGLPKEFGVAETIGRFASEKRAKAFFKSISSKIDNCAAKKLSAKVDQRTSFKTANYSGKAWRIDFEVNKKDHAYYRVAIIRRGRDVAQVTFTPSGEFDVTQKTFSVLADRAGARLRFID